MESTPIPIARGWGARGGFSAPSVPRLFLPPLFVYLFVRRELSRGLCSGGERVLAFRYNGGDPRVRVCTWLSGHLLLRGLNSPVRENDESIAHCLSVSVPSAPCCTVEEDVATARESWRDRQREGGTWGRRTPAWPPPAPQPHPGHVSLALLAFLSLLLPNACSRCFICPAVSTCKSEPSFLCLGSLGVLRAV